MVPSVPRLPTTTPPPPPLPLAPLPFPPFSTPTLIADSTTLPARPRHLRRRLFRPPSPPLLNLALNRHSSSRLRAQEPTRPRQAQTSPPPPLVTHPQHLRLEEVGVVVVAAAEEVARPLDRRRSRLPYRRSILAHPQARRLTAHHLHPQRRRLWGCRGSPASARSS